MSQATEAVVFNGVPLLVLAAAYAAVTAAVLPALWRGRAQARPLDWALALVFPGIALAAGIFGVLVVHEQRPFGGRVWISFAACLLALAPAVLLLLRWGDRSFVAGAMGRTLAAEARVSARERELEAVRDVVAALARAREPEEVAAPLVRRVAAMLRVGFAGVTVVDGAEAVGLYGELRAEPARWWEQVRVDLRTEPSGIASAVFEAAPVTVYDVSGSSLVSRRLANLVGAQSGAWVPMIAEERVIGVLVVASTEAKRTFAADELSLLQALASEAALALERLRSAAALREALAENSRRLAQQTALLQAAQVVASELELEPVLHLLVEEVTKLLDVDAADCYLLDRERNLLRCAAVHGLDPSLVGFEFAPDDGIAETPVPHPAYDGVSRTLVAPMGWGGETLGVIGVGSHDESHVFDDDDAEMLEAFASLASLALRNAETFAERAHQARVQRGFYRIASLLGEPLSLHETYDAAAQAAAESLGGDFAAVLADGPGGLGIVGGHDVPPEVRELPAPVALAEAAAGGQVLAAPDVAADGRFQGWAAAPFASLLAIPVRDESAGLVLVGFRERRDFTGDDLELAQQVASASRGALERSRLFEAERTARSLSQKLARTGRLLATELDPVAVLEALVGEAAELLDADAAALAALDGDEVVITAAAGEGAADVRGERAPLAAWLAGDVVQSRAPVVHDDVARSESLIASDPVLALGHGAYLGVPLVGREGAVQGVLAVYARTPRRWREEEAEALAALAASAAVALTNAELYQRVAVEREQSVAILANIADGIVAVDRDGHVVLWNRAAEEITGVPAAEAVGRTPAQVLQRELASDTGGTTRLVSIARGDEAVWLSLSEAVMRDPAGAVAGRIFAFRDISAEHSVEQMKTDFVSTVSLELRAPMTSIYGFAQTLLREDVGFGETERRVFLEYIARESERLTEIVDALVNVARLDTGDLAVSLEPTDVRAVVQEVVTAAATDEDEHRFVAELNGETGAAQADPGKLRQVLDELVSNAVKYSPGGGTVTISAVRRGRAVELAVADEGIGIAPSERDRIFTKFYKAGGGAGTGLGLFIARGIVREMGGRMWVESEEGRGSRFVFELPVSGNA
ncbi:MAG TPA: GAF domain-containing protein [Gaiellaceae bacterium]|nr:GAF domain-containing protein [Gaiellaceae bacterium]